jgi:hypothetical protein
VPAGRPERSEVVISRLRARVILELIVPTGTPTATAACSWVSSPQTTSSSVSRSTAGSARSAATSSGARPDSPCSIACGIERGQSTTLQPPMIRNHVVGDAEQPRQRLVMIGAIAGPPAKRSHEHLRRDIVTRLADPSDGVSPHRLPVPLEKRREQHGLLDGARQQFGVS